MSTRQMDNRQLAKFLGDAPCVEWFFVKSPKDEMIRVWKYRLPDEFMFVWTDGLPGSSVNMLSTEPPAGERQ